MMEKAEKTRTPANGSGGGVLTDKEEGRTGEAVIRLDNRLDELERLHAFFEEIGARANWPDRLKFDMTLSCEELLTNTINYGFPQGGRHVITLSVQSSPSAVEIRLEDEGVPFNPLEFEEPDLSPDLEERRIGGLGIFFVRRMMNEFIYERTDTGNRIILRKTI
ncbi:ATP-binding protein [Cohnella cellulosilytica]|uniref:ATP-binding protein n=1 Tax=Cohnella cellulosilytica TaxID=986710 RepID=A0ABW2F450_9BACL